MLPYVNLGEPFSPCLTLFTSEDVANPPRQSPRALARPWVISLLVSNQASVPRSGRALGNDPLSPDSSSGGAPETQSGLHGSWVQTTLETHFPTLCLKLISPMNVSEGEVCFHFVQLVILNVFFWNREKEQFSFCSGRSGGILFPAQGPLAGSPPHVRVAREPASARRLALVGNADT